MKKENLLQEIQTKMDKIATSNNISAINITREDLDYTIKYDIKNRFIFVSLEYEDLTNCDWGTFMEYNDTSCYDLDCLNEYGDNDLDMINHLLDIVLGGR